MDKKKTNILILAVLILLVLSCKASGPKNEIKTEDTIIKIDQNDSMQESIVIDTVKTEFVDSANEKSNVVLEYTDSIENELCKLYKGYDNDEFLKVLKKALLDSRTMGHPFNRLDSLINLFDYKEDGLRFYSYSWSAGSGSYYQTLIQYYDDNDNINAKEVDLYDELLYDAFRFTYKSKVYYILLTFGSYSGKSWSENIRVATIENGEMMLHSDFFPDSFERKDIEQDDYLRRIWSLDNNEDMLQLPLNGYIHDHCLTIHNGGSVTAKTINLEFNKEDLSFIYDELQRAEGLFAESTGKRLSFKLRLNE